MSSVGSLSRRGHGPLNNVEDYHRIVEGRSVDANSRQAYLTIIADGITPLELQIFKHSKSNVFPS